MSKTDKIDFLTQELLTFMEGDTYEHGDYISKELQKIARNDLGAVFDIERKILQYYKSKMEAVCEYYETTHYQMRSGQA